VVDESGRTETLYEHAGGDEGLHRLEQIFYDKVLADRTLEPLFGKGQPNHVEHLTWFTAETFGGPDRFTKRLGFDHLIDVHRGLEITDEQRQRFVELYLEAASEAGLPEDRPFREALREHVEFGANVAQQNSKARTDAELYPLHEVPKWEWSPDGEAKR
jgi:hemoglobin